MIKDWDVVVTDKGYVYPGYVDMLIQEKETKKILGKTRALLHSGLGPNRWKLYHVPTSKNWLGRYLGKTKDGTLTRTDVKSIFACALQCGKIKEKKT